MMMELMERLCPKEDVVIAMPKDDDNYDWGEELTETDDAGESSRGHVSSSVTSPQGIKSRDHTLIDMRGTPLSIRQYFSRKYSLPLLQKALDCWYLSVCLGKDRFALFNIRQLVLKKRWKKSSSSACCPMKR